MKRRDFSLALAATSTATLGLLGSSLAQAQAAFKAGKDFVALSTAAPRLFKWQREQRPAIR